MTTPTKPARQRWQPPVVRRIRAGEAENSIAGGASDSAQFTTS